MALAFQQLDINLQTMPDGQVRLRYLANKDQLLFEDRILDIKDIEAQIKEAEAQYYAYIPGDLLKTGQALYNWLDGQDRFLEKAINEFPQDQLLVLAFQGEPSLLHLPWELLHNGKNYLVNQFEHEIVPIRLRAGRPTQRKPANRALEMVFMATAPIDQPHLDFEGEEVRILEATERLPINLEVEESGNLEELKLLLNQMGEGKVDVVHISGHASNVPEPHFMTEDAHGDLYKARAEDFRNCFSNHKPSLLFLSGCQTGGANDQSGTPSLAESLVKSAFPAVLAWSKPVLDRTATEAASQLYRVLSEGQSLPKALWATYRALLNPKNTETKYPDWHMLRLYAFGQVPVNLITSGRHSKRPRKTEKEFLDSGKKVRVPGRRDFVGRRRVMQNCLRLLRTENEYLGLVLYGTGGLGKSSIAARLSQRLEFFYETKVFYGALDELSFLNKLGFDQQQALERLENRFRSAFDSRNPDKRLLLILDDFEQNFEQEGSKPKDFGKAEFRLTTQASTLLKALLKVLSDYGQDNTKPQLLITSRYSFQLQGTVPTAGSDALRFIPLKGFEKGEWERFRKKQNTEKYDKELVEHCERAADGNPRLLEWLLEVLKHKDRDIDTRELLQKIEAREADFREEVLAEYLFACLDKQTKRLLESLALFEVPVPLSVLQELSGVDKAKQHLETANKISLVEVHEEVVVTQEKHYRLAEAFKKLVPAPEKGQCYAAAKQLALIWTDLSNQEHVRELCRLAKFGENKKVLDDYGKAHVFSLYSEDRYKEAVEWGDSILEFLPKNVSVLLCTGRSWRILGNMEKALSYFEKGKAISEEEPYEKAMFIHEIASVTYDMGEVDKAFELYRNSLAIEEQIGDLEGKAKTLHSIADIFFRKGEVDKALDQYRESLAIKEQLGNTSAIPVTLHNIAVILYQQGQVQEALTRHYEILNITQQHGDLIGQSSTLHQMASIFHDQGDFDTALEKYGESLSIKKQMGDLKGTAITLHQMAGVLCSMAQVESALDHFRMSLSIKEQLGYKMGISATLHQIANVFYDQGKVEEALEKYGESLIIQRQLGDMKGESSTLHQIANILYDQGKVEEALNQYRESLSIAEKLKNLEGQSFARYSIARILAHHKKDFEQAWNFIQKATNDLQQMRSRHLNEMQEHKNAIALSWINHRLGEHGMQEFQKLANEDWDRAIAWLKSKGIDLYPDAD